MSWEMSVKIGNEDHRTTKTINESFLLTEVKPRNK